jgi:tetratricopeptide (TPR) repeat protein
MSSRLFSILAPYGMLLLAVAGLYGQTLGFGYVWDDHTLFLDNTLLREGIFSWATVARPILPDTPYFRPLVLATWMAEMQLFQLKPVYSHAVNVVLHGINTCLLYAIALRIFERHRGAHTASLLAALLYATHPCLVESVAWISGRFDLLATTLLMAGCAIAMARATAVRCGLVGLFALGAMLSKETGVLLAPILVLLTLARYPTQPLHLTLRGLGHYLLAYTGAAAIYLLLRSQGLGFVSYNEFESAQLLNAFLNYERWLRTLSFYTFMSFMPFSAISPRHDLLLELTSFRQHWVSLVVALTMFLVVAGFALRRRAWAMLWLGFYIGIFPVLGFFAVITGETIGAERFLYLPLAMLALAIGALFLALREGYPLEQAVPRLGFLLAAAWLVLSVFVTYTVTSMWESSLKLWSWQYQINPENKLIRNSYLIALAVTPGNDSADKFKGEIERVRANHGGRLPIEVQIVYSANLLVKKDPEALLYLQGLVENAPSIWLNTPGNVQDQITYSGVLANYSQALMIFEGDLDGARAQLQKAKAMSPRGSEYQVAHQMIAIEYLQGRKEIARELYRANLRMLQAYNIHKMHESIRTLVSFTCLRRQGEDCNRQANDFIAYLKEAASP